MVGFRTSVTAAALAAGIVAGSTSVTLAHKPNTWGGLYIGASVGWVGSDIDWTYPNGTKPQGIDASDALLSGHVGIQHQMGQFVLGVEGSWGGTHAFGGNELEGGSCPNAAFNCQGRLHSLWTIGPRLGWTPTNNWLLFVTGGYASGRLETQTINVATGVTFDQSISRHDGWFIGGGVEYALTKNWILGLEYLHVDLDAKNVAPGPFGASEVRNGLTGETDIVRARLSFKLGRPDAHHEPLK